MVLMPAAPKDRALLWAIAVSVLLHLAALAKVRLPEQPGFTAEPKLLSVQLLQLAKQAMSPPRPQPMVRQPAPAAAKSPMPLLAPVASEAMPVPAAAPQPAETTAAVRPLPAVAAPAVPTSAASSPAPAITQPRFDAEYLNNPRPSYPALSRRLGEEGRVLLRVLVSSEGRAREVRVKESSGSARLDQAARDAVDRWRFVPARQGSEPIEAWVLVPITFSLS
ncbi:MAG: energy transducer TonB [Hydrogenophilaceae bacterium]|nr:energy transducer TonB [Hydrogenophilaceae bacterium]